MILKIIGSGSAGNCYLLEGSNESLVIEAGCKISELKKACGFNLSHISGALVSHVHSDHAGRIGEYLNHAIDCYGSDETGTAAGVINHCYFHPVEANRSFFVGNFHVMPFDVVHDVRCYGYLIDHKESGKFVFLTDSHYSPFIFRGLNNVIIEANYSEEIIDNRVMDGKLNRTLRDRVLTSHMSFETATGFLEANDLTMVNNIVLIHLSDGNSHALNFKAETERRFGKPTYIATKGMEIEFNKSSF